jgi:hypothetical protein
VRRKITSCWKSLTKQLEFTTEEHNLMKVLIKRVGADGVFIFAPDEEEMIKQINQKIGYNFID